MINYEINEIVYVLNVGYGMLISCGRKKKLILPDHLKILKLEKLIESEKDQLKKQKLQNVSFEPYLLRLLNSMQSINQDYHLQQNKMIQKQEQQIRGNWQQPNIVTVKLKRSGFIVYTPQINLRKCINIKVKTFFGKRKQLQLLVSINNNFAQIGNIVILKLQQNLTTFYNIRFIFPCGNIQQLQMNKTVKDYQLMEGSRIIFLASITFCWDKNLKAIALKLTNNDTTVIKTAQNNLYQTVLGSIGFISGRHYWEIKIDKFSDNQDIFIGVAHKNIDLNQQPSEILQYWGYMPLCAKKFGPQNAQNNLIDYGYISKIGDIIGVLLQFRQGYGNLEFFKNGNNCGIAYTGLKGTLYPAVTLLFTDVQITLDTKTQIPLTQSFYL